MDRKTTTELMRLLHDELPDSVARDLRDRLQREPELQRQFETLEQQWRGLELPDPEPAPPGFARRVSVRARERADQGLAPCMVEPYAPRQGHDGGPVGRGNRLRCHPGLAQ